MIKEDGYTPAGASSVRRSLVGNFDQDFTCRIQNNKAWGEKLKKANVNYFIATSWARGNSLGNPVFNMELMLYTLASGGYFSWNGGGDIEKFKRFFENYIYSVADKPDLNMPVSDIITNLSFIKCRAFHAYMKDNIMLLQNALNPFYKTLSLYIKTFIIKREYESSLERITNVLYRIESEKDYPVTVKNDYISVLRNFHLRFICLEKTAFKLFKKYILISEAKELAQSLFYYQKKEIRSLIDAINQTIQ
jgi:hypothetical protein